MTAIVNSVEIARSPAEVFAYLDELERHGDWQEQIVSLERLTEGPTAVGTRVAEVRRIGGREQRMSWEVTEHDPPHTFGFRGVDGPIRPIGRGVVEAAGDGTSTRLTMTLDFEGHGVGKFMLPLVRTQARKQLVADGERLKAALEAAPTG